MDPISDMSIRSATSTCWSLVDVALRLQFYRRIKNHYIRPIDYLLESLFWFTYFWYAMCEIVNKITIYKIWQSIVAMFCPFSRIDKSFMEDTSNSEWRRNSVKISARKDINFMLCFVCKSSRSRQAGVPLYKGWNEATKMHARSHAIPQSFPASVRFFEPSKGVFSSLLIWNGTRLLPYFLASVTFHQFYRLIGASSIRFEKKQIYDATNWVFQ